MENFETTIAVRWADVDQNKHVRHSAYYDYGAHVRILFFKHIGFDFHKMDELKIGPILFKEECSFIREVKPGETIRIKLLKGEISEKGDRWIFHHEIFNEKNQKAAHITIQGAWMDLEKRRLTIPPQDLAESLKQLPQGEAYVYKKGK